MLTEEEQKGAGEITIWAKPGKQEITVCKEVKDLDDKNNRLL